jgi:hypothetical protein
MLWITIAGVLSFASVFVALEINNGVCIYRKYERAGDVKFLVVAGIRERDGQGACGKSSMSIFEQIVALDWIVSLLNGNGTREDSIIPGVSIGNSKFIPYICNVKSPCLLLKRKVFNL